MVVNRNKVLGTIEPEYFGKLSNEDDVEVSLAFIAGAIKKYGNDPDMIEDLVDYISGRVSDIKRSLYEY